MLQQNQYTGYFPIGNPPPGLLLEFQPLLIGNQARSEHLNRSVHYAFMPGGQ